MCTLAKAFGYSFGFSDFVIARISGTFKKYFIPTCYKHFKFARTIDYWKPGQESALGNSNSATVCISLSVQWTAYILGQ